MAEDDLSGSPSEVTVFWFRQVGPVQLARVRDCHRKGAELPSARLGMGQSVAAVLSETSRSGRSGLVKGQKEADRAAVMDAMDRKLNLLLGLAYPPESVLIRAPVLLDPDGLGVVAWLKNPPFVENDVLEMRFLAGPGLPWPFHGYGRVARVGKDWSTRGARVEFRFETVHGAEQNQKSKVVRPAEPRREFSKPVLPPVPEVRPAASSRGEVLMPPSSKAQPESTRSMLAKAKEKGDKPVIETKIRKPLPQLELPSLKVDGEDKYEKMLKDGLQLSKAAIEDVPIKKGGDPYLASQPMAESRRDFRINDRIPFVWCHVSEASFQEAMVNFGKEKAFGLRSIIRKQQQILQDLAEIQEFLKRKRSKARKHVDWHRDRLSWLFLRASSENEEEYYQGITEIFTAIAGDLANQSAGAAQWSNQALSHLRQMMELQQLRDQSNPITEMNALKKANAGLIEIERQFPKVLAKVEEMSPSMAAKLKMYFDAVNTVNLSQNDRPVGKTPDGKDLFTVNISATGIAFRTRRLWVKKGDLLEMRIFLSITGDRFEPVNTYGRVVFVNGPVDNKLKVATHIDPKPTAFEQKIYQHIARRQRELLSSRSAIKDEDDF